MILQPSKVNVQLVLNPLQLRWPSIASNLCQKGLEGPPAANTTIAAVYAPEFPQKSLVLIHPHVGFIPLLSTYTCTSPAFYTTNHYIPTVAGDLCFNLQELQQTGAPASELGRTAVDSIRLSAFGGYGPCHPCQQEDVGIYTKNILKYHQSSTNYHLVCTFAVWVAGTQYGPGKLLADLHKVLVAISSECPTPQKHLRDPRDLHMILSDLIDAVHWV